jgi:hypothetical protein
MHEVRGDDGPHGCCKLTQQVLQGHQDFATDPGRAQNKVRASWLGHPRRDAHSTPVREFTNQPISATTSYSLENGECLTAPRMPSVINSHGFMGIM